MNAKFKTSLLCALMAAFAAGADDAVPDRKLSYALGMNLALNIKNLGADVDVDAVVRALKDVAAGKPTLLQPSELKPIFSQEEKYQRLKTSTRDKEEGEAFLAKNAKAEGVTVLPDGLQYKVIHEGDGPVPKRGDDVIIKYRGLSIAGKQFDKSDEFETPAAAVLRGWQDALLRMKVGSRWQIFVPPNLAYGHEWMQNIGPESTVIFDIELVSLKPAK